MYARNYIVPKNVSSFHSVLIPFGMEIRMIWNDRLNQLVLSAYPQCQRPSTTTVQRVDWASEKEKTGAYSLNKIFFSIAMEFDKHDRRNTWMNNNFSLLERIESYPANFRLVQKYHTISIQPETLMTYHIQANERKTQRRRKERRERREREKTKTNSKS